jgi:hypothetical protein
LDVLREALLTSQRKPGRSFADCSFGDGLPGERDPLVTVWPALTEAMYLLNFSWRAQDALWELVLEETVWLLPVEADNHRRVAIRHIRYKGRKLTKDGRAFLDRERPDICVFGHTHQPKVEWLGKMILFNPGSAGPKRFKLPRGVGILILTRQGITPKHILLDGRMAKVTPHGAMKSYLGCVSGSSADLSVKKGQKLRTLLQRRRAKS